MKEFAALRPKIFDYLTDDSDENKKKQQVQEMCVIKQNLKFKYYKNFLEGIQLEDKINQLEKSKLPMDSLWLNHKNF